MSKEENFDDLCGKILNMKSYDSKILFSRWDIYDENERWLAWIWGKLREKGGSYLHAVLQRTQKVDDFMKEAAVTIFRYLLRWSFAFSVKTYFKNCG